MQRLCPHVAAVSSSCYSDGVLFQFSNALVTGAAGFIGMHVASRLLDLGVSVAGVDCLTEYGGKALKQDRLAVLSGRDGFTFHRVDLSDAGATRECFESVGPSIVIHLAGQPGVRHSLDEPGTYLQHNVIAFGNVLESCRHTAVRHLIFASSSSVYGATRDLPHSPNDRADQPLSLYAASKRSGEMMAHAYAHLFSVPTTALRFFTVYGPWGRPDMAASVFARAILAGSPVDLYEPERTRRDFTYVEDVAEAVVRIAVHPPETSPRTTSAIPYRVYNIGKSTPVSVLELVSTLERLLGRTTEKRILPAHPSEVVGTWADVSSLERDIGFRPQTPLEDGLRHFVSWFRGYHSGSLTAGRHARPPFAGRRERSE